MDEVESDIESRVLERVAELQDQATKEAERTHRVAAVLAERVAAYYRDLMGREVPEALVEQLVIAYHERMLTRAYPVERDRWGAVKVVNAAIYVPVPSSEG